MGVIVGMWTVMVMEMAVVEEKWERRTRDKTVIELVGEEFGATVRRPERIVNAVGLLLSA